MESVPNRGNINIKIAFPLKNNTEAGSIGISPGGYPIKLSYFTIE